MTGPTIVNLPPTVTAYTARAAGATPTPLSSPPTTPATASATTLATPCSEGFALYLPYSHTAALAVVNISALLEALDPGPPAAATTTYEIFSGIGSPVAPITVSSESYTLSSDHTLYIPYTASLPQNVLIASLVQSLSAVPLISPTPDLTSTTVPISSGSLTSSAPRSGSLSTIGSLLTTPSTAAPTPQASPTEGVKEGTFTGAVVGGAVGGFLVGLVVCALLALWCIRRRSSARMRHGTPIDGDDSKIEKTQVFTATTEVTGWHQHLPQAQDERTIVNAFRSLFAQTRAHVDGFYGQKSSNISSRAIASLESIWPDDLPTMLLQTDDPAPLLEAVLIRWIIHSISLRSDQDGSLLPAEYTQIPNKNRWHMERDEQEVGLTAESRRGFPQALSQWRLLTSFLRPDPATDPEYQGSLDMKVDQAVQTLTEAFSPWDLIGKGSTSRMDSLRKILHQASAAGILLFAQPSTFMFDWSRNHRSGDRAIVVAPALVKRLDALAERLQPAQVLIEAKWAVI